MNTYALMTRPQKLACFENVAKEPLIIGGIAAIKQAPHRRYVITDVDETMRGTMLILMAHNGRTKKIALKDVHDVLLPDGRWLRRCA